MPSIHTSLLTAVPAGLGQMLPGSRREGVRAYMARREPEKAVRRGSGHGRGHERRQQGHPGGDLAGGEKADEPGRGHRFQDRERSWRPCHGWQWHASRRRSISGGRRAGCTHPSSPGRGGRGPSVTVPWRLLSLVLVLVLALFSCSTGEVPRLSWQRARRRSVRGPELSVGLGHVPVGQEVAPRRDLAVTWRSYCLEIRDDYGVAPTVPEHLRKAALAGHAVSHRMLRIFEAARARAGEHAVDALFAEWGRGSSARSAYGRRRICWSACVAASGLPPDLVGAADDEKWDAPIIEAMEVAYAFGGPKTQTPTIVVRADPPYGFKGPVMAPAPTGDAAAAAMGRRPGDRRRSRGSSRSHGPAANPPMPPPSAEPPTPPGPSRRPQRVASVQAGSAAPSDPGGPTHGRRHDERDGEGVDDLPVHDEQGPDHARRRTSRSP